MDQGERKRRKYDEEFKLEILPLTMNTKGRWPKLPRPWYRERDYLQVGRRNLQKTPSTPSRELPPETEDREIPRRKRVPDYSLQTLEASSRS